MKANAKQWFVKIVLAWVALIVIAAGGTVFAYPAVAAVACPACYGLERLGSNTFIELGMPSEDRAHLAEVLAGALERVSVFYGGFTASPRILVCATENCYRHIGGHRERGVSFFDYALLLSPRGLDVVIASHELSHIEMHHRLGFIRSLSNAVPAWFDEGTAVIVSNDQRYLAPADRPNRCLMTSNEQLPATMSEWNRAAGKLDSHVYANAACRVSEWLSQREGYHSVVALVRMVSGGTPFSLVYQQQR